MTFQEAMVETVKQSQEENRLVYLYKAGSSGFEWVTSSHYWQDWLFKSYPGGRKVMSERGVRLLKPS